jgi:hypothetical protein
MGWDLVQSIRAGKLEARPFLFLNFKRIPSQEEHNTIFSSLKISLIALSDQFDLGKMISWNFIKSWIQQSAVAFARKF